MRLYKISIDYIISDDYLVWAATDLLRKQKRVCDFSPLTREKILDTLRSGIEQNGAMFTDIAGEEWPAGVDDLLPRAQQWVDALFPAGVDIQTLDGNIQ